MFAIRQTPRLSDVPRVPAAGARHLVRGPVLRLRRLPPARRGGRPDRALPGDRGGLVRRAAGEAAARGARDRAVCRGGGQAGGAGGPERRGGAAARAVRGSRVRAQGIAARRPRPVRPAVVRDHRRPRLRQDDRPPQFRAHVPAGAARREGGAAGGRRHAELRLVVHRRSGLPRHGRPLHHAGLGRDVGQRGVVGVPLAAAQVPGSGARSTASSSRSAPPT